MQGIKDTNNSMIQFVYPEYANNLGKLHGGRLMDWIMLIGSITSSRLAKGPTLLGATDSIDFLNPIGIGEIVIMDSWVEYVSNTSLEVLVRVYSENLETGEKKFITLSNLAFVAIDRNAKPREVPKKIEPQDDFERSIYKRAKKRRVSRLLEIKKRKDKVVNIVDETEVTRHNLETLRTVLPEDAFYGNFMSVGKLLKYIDECAGILAMRYVKGVLVTGSLDNLFFYKPIRVGEVVTLKAGITHVGNTSLEIATKVFSEDLEKNTLNHTCTAFLTFVHVDKDGKPSKITSFQPETPYEVRVWKEAEKRKEIRKQRLKTLKKHADHYLDNYQKYY